MQCLKRSFLSIAFLLGILVVSSQAQPVPVMLTWDAYPWPSEVGTLRLEYSVNSQTVWYDNGALPGASTSVETSAGAGVCFRIIAVPTAGDVLLGYLNSPPSNSACYVTPIVLPAPTGLRLSIVWDHARQRLQAAWDPYQWPDVGGYFTLEQRRPGSSIWAPRGAQMISTATVMFANTNLWNGCWRLLAHEGSVNSPPSQIACR